MEGKILLGGLIVSPEAYTSEGMKNTGEMGKLLRGPLSSASTVNQM